MERSRIYGQSACLLLIAVLSGLLVVTHLRLERQRNPWYRTGYALTKPEVLRAMGKPAYIVKRGQPLLIGGASPVPPSAEGREVWVYPKLMMYTLVYFGGRSDRVEVIAFTST